MLPFRRRLSWLLLLPFFAASLQSQTPAPNSGDTRPTFQANARVVVVDVVVTDRNDRSVPGLHKDDFEVLEDGQPQTVTFFEEHTGATPVAAKPSAPLPPNTYSNLPPTDSPDSLNVLLLDALNTPLDDQFYVHKKMVQYLAGIHPGTRLAIFTMSTRLRLIQGFTTDPSLLLAALNDKKSGAGPQRSPSLLSSSEVHSQQQLLGQLSSGHASPGAIDALRQFMAENTQFQTNTRVADTLFQFQQLALYLGGFPGRKNVIWFSGGFPFNIFQPSTNNPNAGEINQTADLLTKAEVAIYPVEASGLVYSLYDASTIPPNVTANAQQATQQQIRDLHRDTTHRNGDHALMDEIAKDTGGEAFYNDNGLDDALSTAIYNGARYYTLDYTPPNQNMDGRYRQIEVKLTHGKYKLAYRRGYNADDTNMKAVNLLGQAPAADPLQPLMAAGLPDFAEIVFRMSAKPSNPQPDAKAAHAGDNPRLDGPFTRFGVDFAIQEKDLKLDPAANGLRQGKLEVTLLAYDHYGHVMNWLVRTMEFSLTPLRYSAYLRAGLQFHFDIDAPQDSAYLRSGIYDMASGKAGTIEIPLSMSSAVPAAATAQAPAPLAAKPN